MKNKLAALLVVGALLGGGATVVGSGAEPAQAHNRVCKQVTKVTRPWYECINLYPGTIPRYGCSGNPTVTVVCS